MASFKQSPGSALVIGLPTYVNHSIDSLRAKGFQIDILDMTGLSKEEFYVKLDKQASTRPYQALLFFSHAFRVAPWGERLFSKFPNLKFATSLGAGYDKTTVDMDYLTRNKIVYANNPNAVAVPTAILATTLILNTVRGISEVENLIREGRWEKGQRLPRTIDSRDVTVGIIGMGNIGKTVCHHVEALGMKVIYYNRHRLPAKDEGSAVYHSLPSLLATADLITLHTPLTDETHHLLSDKEFNSMKDGVLIVNTGRGSLIDEVALVRAMESEKVARVGLDVFEYEPKIHPYLMTSPRATLTPHWGAQTVRAAAEVEQEALDNYVAWTDNGRGNTPVNIPEGGWLNASL